MLRFIINGLVSLCVAESNEIMITRIELATENAHKVNGNGCVWWQYFIGNFMQRQIYSRLSRGDLFLRFRMGIRFKWHDFVFTCSRAQSKKEFNSESNAKQQKVATGLNNIINWTVGLRQANWNATAAHFDPLQITRVKGQPGNSKWADMICVFKSRQMWVCGFYSQFSQPSRSNLFALIAKFHYLIEKSACSREVGFGVQVEIAFVINSKTSTHSGRTFSQTDSAGKCKNRTTNFAPVNVYCHAIII